MTSGTFKTTALVAVPALAWAVFPPPQPWQN